MENNFSSPEFRVNITPEDVQRMTDHTGTYYVHNKIEGFSNEIIALTVVHSTSRFGRQSTNFSHIPTGGRTAGTKFKYTTGAFSPFDYWYVEGHVDFGPGMATFRTKDNFYCSVAASDDGNIELILTSYSLDGSPYSLQVEFSDSSGCETMFV